MSICVRHCTSPKCYALPRCKPLHLLSRCERHHRLSRCESQAALFNSQVCFNCSCHPPVIVFFGYEDDNGSRGIGQFNTAHTSRTLGSALYEIRLQLYFGPEEFGPKIHQGLAFLPSRFKPPDHSNWIALEV